MDDLRYPVGKWTPKPSVDAAECATMIQQIAAAPSALAGAVKGLTDAQLDTPYRDGGWTPRQIVHHIADSHMNAYIRFKLGITEDNPTVKPYNEKTWAETIDGRTAPVDVSLPMIDSLHKRWVQFLKSLDQAALSRTVMHPERGPMKLSDLLQLYLVARPPPHGAHYGAAAAERMVESSCS